MIDWGPIIERQHQAANRAGEAVEKAVLQGCAPAEVNMLLRRENLLRAELREMIRMKINEPTQP